MIIKKIIKISIAGLIPLLLVTSCGNDSTAPDNGSIVIAMSPGHGVPDDPTDPLPACVGATVLINVVTITVFDSGDNKLGNVDIDVTLALAGNAVGNLGAGLFGFGVVDLFDDQIGDGNNAITDINGAFQMNEHVSGLSNPQIYKTQTDPEGTKTLFFVSDASGDCEYTAVLTVTSGALTVSSEYEAAI